MFKKMLLSSLAGIFATTIFLATPNAEASCQGYCMELLVYDGCEHVYNGCAVTYDENHNPQSVTCNYSIWCMGEEPDPRGPFIPEP